MQYCRKITMPEYFSISFIVDREKQQQKKLIKKYLLTQFNLKKGRNNIKDSEYSMLAYREVLLFFYNRGL